MAPNNPPDRPVAPAFFDDGDDGLWADALRFVRFPVLEFEPVDDGGRERVDALAPASSAPFHNAGDTRG
jgi:hypothetical protein